MCKSKFDTYFEICQKLVTELSDIGCKELQPLIDGFRHSIDQINVWVSDNSFPVSKSEIAKGLEQGVNELPLLFEELENDVRSKTFQLYYRSINAVIPDYQEKLSSRVQHIIKRGKIKSESEYYLLQNRLDKIECSGTNEEAIILDLLAQYEVKE